MSTLPDCDGRYRAAATSKRPEGWDIVRIRKGRLPGGGCTAFEDAVAEIKGRHDVWLYGGSARDWFVFFVPPGELP